MKKLKILCPISVTEEGNEIFISELQLSKAHSPIVIKVLGNSIFFKAEQHEKDSFPIVFKVDGSLNDTCSNFLHPTKAQ